MGGGDRDEGVPNESPRYWQGLCIGPVGDGVNGNPEVAPTRLRGAFPEGRHAFLASGGKEANLLLPPGARREAAPEAGDSGQLQRPGLR